MRRLKLIISCLHSLISATLFLPASAQKLNNNGCAQCAAANSRLPVKDGSVRFAVIGDTGSGTEQQRDVGDMMIKYRALFPFEFVLMMGDNMYGGEAPKDFEKKFSEPYKALLDNKVKFYATLGNHDQPMQTNYENFNMNGKEYYRFKKGNIAFYSLEQQLHGQEAGAMARRRVGERHGGVEGLFLPSSALLVGKEARL